MTASILVADDHDIARAGLIAMIGGQDDFHVALDVRDGADAVEAAALHKPDLALLDIRMPRMDGLAATREIRRVSPGTRVMIITMHDSLDYLEAAIEAGATGYLLKDASRDDILRTIRRVLSGDAFFDGPLVARLLKRAATKPQTNASALETLTVREREVLSKVARGPDQQGDRPGAEDLPRHREDPCRAHHRQARRRRPHAGRRHGGARRAGADGEG